MSGKINDGLTPQARYDRKNCTGLYLKLNQKTDADIISRFDETANKQGYIKSLIRADIARNIEPTTNE